MTKKILVYGTEKGTIYKLIPVLKQEEIHTYLVENSRELFDLLKCDNIYLVIVEMKNGKKELPAELELLCEIRKRSIVPIIVISEEKSESAKIKAFHAGADDYIVTDCCPVEVLARIRAQLNRYMQLSNIPDNIDSIYRVGELVVDDNCRKVLVNGRNVNLTPIEYKILKLLVKEQGKAISISQIYETIWKMKAVEVDNTVAVHICHIREKIERNPKKPQYLKVVWGTGYKVG